jgi:hypothetical protein
MHSTQPPRETDPHDVFVIEPDVVLAARTDQAPYETVPHAIDDASASPAFLTSGASPSAVDTTFRATDVNNIRSRGGRPSSGSRWMARASIAFLFALCSAFAAAAWQHYGYSDAAKQMIADWTPQRLIPTSLQAQEPTATAQPDSAVAQADAPAAPSDQAASTAPTQLVNPAQPQETAAPAVAAPAESTQTLQSMARDLASMGQQIEELKATIAQLKAGQQQMAGDIANNSAMKPAPGGNALAKNAAIQPPVINQRPKPAPPPLRSAAAPAARKPAPAFSPALATTALRAPQPAPATALPQAAPAPLPPPALQAQPAAPPDDGEPVLRPPMPLR